MSVLDTIIRLLFCHCVGDYVLQSDFIAKTKGDNFYHLFIHCVLYCLPFYLCFGLRLELLTLFLSHLYIDVFKARYKTIDYKQDQIMHYLTMLIYLIPIK